jgi:hypothetical protein
VTDKVNRYRAAGGVYAFAPEREGTRYRPRPRTPPTTLAGFSRFRPAVLVISMPFGRPPRLGTLFETRARLMPSTSPTCFFAVLFFADLAVVRVVRVVRDPEDVVFFAKLPPLESRDVEAL